MTMRNKYLILYLKKWTPRADLMELALSVFHQEKSTKSDSSAWILAPQIMAINRLRVAFPMKAIPQS